MVHVCSAVFSWPLRAFESCFDWFISQQLVHLQHCTVLMTSGWKTLNLNTTYFNTVVLSLVDNSSGQMIRLKACIYTQTNYQMNYCSLPKFIPDG